MNDTLIVIPTYNEKENVQDIARAIFAQAQQVDILFVDDSSPDGTGEIADAMHVADSRVNVLHRKEKQGLGRAYIAGFKWALARHYEFIFEMDCDFSHDPKSIVAIRKAADTADLALGTRYLGGIRVINWPLSRLFLSVCAAFYVKIVTGMRFTDPTGGFKCYRRAVLETINLDRITSNGYSFQIEMTHSTWRLGFKIAEVPIVFEERRSGASKMNSNIVREALTMVWKLLFRSHLRRCAGPVHPRSVAARSA